MSFVKPLQLQGGFPILSLPKWIFKNRCFCKSQIKLSLETRIQSYDSAKCSSVDIFIKLNLNTVELQPSKADCTDKLNRLSQDDRKSSPGSAPKTSPTPSQKNHTNSSCNVHSVGIYNCHSCEFFSCGMSVFWIKYFTNFYGSPQEFDKWVLFWGKICYSIKLANKHGRINILMQRSQIVAWKWIFIVWLQLWNKNISLSYACLVIIFQAICSSKSVRIKSIYECFFFCQIFLPTGSDLKPPLFFNPFRKGKKQGVGNCFLFPRKASYPEYTDSGSWKSGLNQQGCPYQWKQATSIKSMP